MTRTRSLCSVAWLFIALPAHAAMPPISFDAPARTDPSKAWRAASPAERDGAAAACQASIERYPAEYEAMENGQTEANAIKATKARWQREQPGHWERRFDAYRIRTMYRAGLDLQAATDANTLICMPMQYPDGQF